MSQSNITIPEGGPDPNHPAEPKPLHAFKKISRDELLYYYLKRKKFASDANSQNAADFEETNKGRSLRKLPHVKKQLAAEAQREKIEKVRLNNQSLPSLYLDYSRAIGRKNIDKQIPENPLENSNVLADSLDFDRRDLIDKNRQGYKQNYSSGAHWQNFWNVNHLQNGDRLVGGTKKYEEKQRSEGYWLKKCSDVDMGSRSEVNTLVREIRTIENHAEIREQFLKLGVEVRSVPIIPKTERKGRQKNLVYIAPEEIETSWVDASRVSREKVNNSIVVNKMTGEGVVNQVVSGQNVMEAEGNQVKHQDVVGVDSGHAEVVEGYLVESELRVSPGPRNNITDEELVNNDAGFLYSTAARAKIALLDSMIDYDDGAGKKSPRVRVGVRKRIGASWAK